MVGLIQVGEAKNLNAAKAAKMPGKVKQRFEEAFAKVN